MERIVIMNPQIRVDARHIPLNRPSAPFRATVERFGSLQEVRARRNAKYILKKPDETKGNVTRTANSWAWNGAIFTER